MQLGVELVENPRLLEIAGPKNYMTIIISLASLN